MHRNEVATLQTILIDQWWPTRQEMGSEDGQHTGVWVAQRLTRPIRIEEPQRHGRDSVRAPGEETQPLLVILGQCVNRFERGYLALRGGQGLKGTARGIQGLPYPGVELLGSTPCIGNEHTVDRLVQAFS